MQTMVKQKILSVLLASGFLLFSATSASAFALGLSTTANAGWESQWPKFGDTISVTAYFDTEGEADIQILSASLLFDPNVFELDLAASASPSYALYAAGRGNRWLQPPSTNMTCRVVTSGQFLLDWSSSYLPDGTTSGCGQFGIYPAVPGTPAGFDCGFIMARLEFKIVGPLYGAFITLTDDSPGNILQLGDGSNPNLDNASLAWIPEPTTAWLLGMGLAGLAMKRRRAL